MPSIRHHLAIAKALAVLVAAAAAAWTIPTEARVTRIVVDQRAPEGQPFPEVGQFERLSGRAFVELDPDDPRNRIIQDIELAPRNASGKVEYVATFSLMKPVDLSKASGVLMYSVVNRGNGTADAERRGTHLAGQRLAGRRHADRRGTRPSRCRWRGTRTARRSRSGARAIQRLAAGNDHRADPARLDGARPTRRTRWIPPRATLTVTRRRKP